MIKLAIIGGTGLDEFLEDGIKKEVTAIYRDKGQPVERSYNVESYMDGKVVFVNRHNVYLYPAQLVSPSNIDYNSLMVGLHQQGVTHVISTSAVGISRQDLGPGTIGVPDDFIDGLNFDVTIEVDGVTPDYICAFFDEELRRMIKDSADQNSVNICDGGIYVRQKCGMVFESRAQTRSITADHPEEILYYGMTVPQELILASSFGADESIPRMRYANITVATNPAADLVKFIDHLENAAAFGNALPGVKKILKGVVEELFRV